MSVISVKNLSVKYNASDVFYDVSFEIASADYVALVGPNGSGKSTLIKAILGLLKPVKGEIYLFGKSLNEFKEWHRIGYVPQKVFLNADFPATVEEIVSMGLISKTDFPKRIKKIHRSALEKVLKIMDIEDLRKKNIGELSGGQQQRVIIARALINEPDLLVLDEPTTAIDPDSRDRFFSILSEMNKDRHVTIILVTHDTGSVGKYASKFLYFDRKIIFFGTFKDFCESKSMAEYFGKGSQHLICHRHD
jgi:zinc transport system ATP-binding protein